MQAHRMRVVIPEDHRAIVEFPESIRSGPVELIVLVPPENEKDEIPQLGRLGSMAALAEELAKDPRTFRELSPDERSTRLERVMGIGRGLLSTGEEFARNKKMEIELEEKNLPDNRLYVLDSSAVVALLHREPGAETVAEILKDPQNRCLHGRRHRPD